MNILLLLLLLICDFLMFTAGSFAGIGRKERGYKLRTYSKFAFWVTLPIIIISMIMILC